MEGLTAAAILATINSLVLTGIFFYIYQSGRDLAVKIWLWSWVFYTGRLLANVYITLAEPIWVAVLLNHSCAAISGYLLLRGSFAYVGRKTSSAWLVLGVAAILWTTLSLGFELPFFAMAMPAYAYLGVGTVVAGMVLGPWKGDQRLGNWAASISLILWGLHKFNFPILRPVEPFAPYGYLIGATLSIVVGATLLVSIVERGQAALQRSESRFRSTVDAMDDIIFSLDPAGVITGVFGRWLDGHPGELVGKSIIDGFGAEEGRIHTEHLNRVLANQTEVYEWTRREPTGERYYQTTLSPITDREGDIIGAVGVGRDITALKRTQKRLQTGIQERETLLREIHHRVKNNLQVVSSLISLQTARVSDPESVALFKAAASRVIAMAMVHEQLYVSESLSEIDLSDFVRRLVELVAASQAPEGITITKNVRATRVHIEVERAVPCALVVNELVSNAFKHAFAGRRKGHIDVLLDVEQGSEAGSETVCLTVSDDGIGMTKDIREISTGLGSVLITELAGQLGATVKQYDQQGTTIRVSFPRHIALPMPPADL